MITCFLRYVVDPYKLQQFETYGKMWIPLVEKFGGTHHGYFLPSEGDNDIALAMFTFSSLAAYETYRQQSMEDPACIAAFRYAEETRCIVRYERSFFRPVFE
ncbi:NIPSNAP family protein [Burkholderia stagnalis]|uniref:NIPSNAP family protein n=1 Tax=Burkholderia stagnalis TaxID=1503054 RepID=UPI000F565401|nr:NIPSNAP family protein [Burkholderia stagnalis]RQP97266.1 NIPSNAP family protein [Burkholderia stagnalis]RQQ06154.1 NIPSNAP family protein [Burkholderia stagnalis]RQQ21787.1 NIPSNAP family protein [Burkholderia stagnalis]RQQ23444.1 NIPSNAP family protein [Burkholderia stagnalis]RQQ25043.1 NIPSNAP family protein [Burkholderia stagnalis]